MDDRTLSIAKDIGVSHGVYIAYEVDLNKTDAASYKRLLTDDPDTYHSDHPIWEYLPEPNLNGTYSLENLVLDVFGTDYPKNLPDVINAYETGYREGLITEFDVRINSLTI
jgi:hypothetical protein